MSTRWTRLANRLRDATELLARTVWPGRCAACDVLLAPDEELFCPTCGLTCKPLGLVEPPDGCAAAFAVHAYDGALQAAIQRWKYGPRVDLARGLATRLAEHANDALDAMIADTIPTIVPLPSHANRLRARGFDHARILARSVRAAVRSRYPAVRFDDRCVVRCRDTPPQASLDRVARLDNVAEAFRARRALSGPVCLIDDVITTGATAAACASALRAAGAGPVVVLALAAVRSPASGPA